MLRPHLAALEPLIGHVQALTRDNRQVIAIAGAPASGKSVLGDALRGALCEHGIPTELVPMDGFHLDNRVLDARGLRRRKGAPETFDFAGFHALLQRLRTEKDVVYPVFDRVLDLSIAGVGVVTEACKIVIVEGNYLLFDEQPWSVLAQEWDLSIRLDTPEDVILQRCITRWLAHGHDLNAARKRAEENDLPNARRIISAQLPADITVTA
jgi:fructokinase